MLPAKVLSMLVEDVSMMFFDTTAPDTVGVPLIERSFTAYTTPLTVASPDQLIEPFTISQPFRVGIWPDPVMLTVILSLEGLVQLWLGPGAVQLRLFPLA